MTAHETLLVLGCDGAVVRRLGSCARDRGVDLLVVHSMADLARQVVSRQPVAIIVGIRVDVVADVDAIAMVHAVDKGMPVITIANADSIELERKARETSVFYYLVEPVQDEELEAVMDDVLRYRRDR